jgi:hypothetical protein
MKQLTLLMTITFSLILFSCKKDSTTSTPSLILGHWNVSSDSAMTFFSGQPNSPVWSDIYGGVSGDYFIVNSNGTINEKEGSTTNTISYQLIDSNTMVFPNAIGAGISDTGKITILTSNYAKLVIKYHYTFQYIGTDSLYEDIIDVSK